MAAKKLVFLNQKGGVGKTTSCANLGSIIASMGYKVLLVDLDSQGNLSSAVSADTMLPGTYELIAGGKDQDFVQNTPVQNLYCLSGGINLAGLNVELANLNDRNHYLKKALEGFDDIYDYIFVDCPPDLGILTMNALAWTKYVFIPMQCEYFAMEGLNLLMRTVSNVKKSLNPEIEIIGIGFMMYSKRSNLSNEVVEDISNYFDKLVFKTKIPRNVRLSEAPSHGLPINAYDNSSAGGKAYRELALEVIDRAI
ncbi:MAG: ParA family protein [Spirochaetales bacterium]|nr:ParA family protein [Spirochaetales bacterium]